MNTRLLNTIKHDKVFLILLILFCASVIGAILLGTANLYSIGLIYLSITILGVALTRRWDVKKFLILLGASIAVFFLSTLLYNLVYGLLLRWFGADFWNRLSTGDEFFFFSIAVFICPVGFVIGVFGSIILAIKKRAQRNKTVAVTKNEPYHDLDT